MLSGTRSTLWSVRIGLTEGDATSSEIIRSELYCDGVSRDETDEMFLHLATDIGPNHHVRELFW
jgi:hypothetical protein